jgi:CubicO group peptidase (beta-lactamase class C family)
MHGESSRIQRTRAAIISALLAAPMIFGCGLLSTVNQNLSQTCYQGSCLVYTTWGQNIDAKINQKAVGYAYIIMNHGLLETSKAFGTTRTPSDTAPAAPAAMTLDARTNAASVTKTMTAVAALKLLAAQNLSVKTSIAGYLPPSWQLGPGVSAITFEQLLTHTSGIQNLQPSNAPAQTYAQLKTLVANGVSQSYKAQCQQNYAAGAFASCYNNANFALFRILIPHLNGFSDAGVQDLATATAQQYLSYMNSVYGPDIPITCTPAANAVWSYPYPPGSTKGTDWGDWMGLCGGGGLYLSAQQMGVFLANLMLGIYLPTTSNNPNETTLPTMVSKMYGWDATWTDAHGTCVMKNGDLGGGTPFVPYLSTLYIYCPTTGLGFVGLANSTLPVMAVHNYGFSGALDDIVYQAYIASWQAQP